MSQELSQMYRERSVSDVPGHNKAVSACRVRSRSDFGQICRRDSSDVESQEVVYLSMPQVVERYAGVWSRWQLYEHVRRGMLPHVKLPGRRELLFRLEDLERYELGEVELELVRLPRGGRLCRHRQR